MQDNAKLSDEPRTSSQPDAYMSTGASSAGSHKLT